jgi:hypothetical protein
MRICEDTDVVGVVPDTGFGPRFRQCVGANNDVGEPVSRVKATSASQIGPPPVALEKWLDFQAGTDAAIAWVVRTADAPGRGVLMREADISLHGRPAWVVMMAAGTSKAGI